eukprot:247884-Pelagomonas_calceolata.AAC.1
MQLNILSMAPITASQFGTNHVMQQVSLNRHVEHDPPGIARWMSYVWVFRDQMSERPRDTESFSIMYEYENLKRGESRDGSIPSRKLGEGGGGLIQPQVKGMLAWVAAVSITIGKDAGARDTGKLMSFLGCRALAHDYTMKSAAGLDKYHTSRNHTAHEHTESITFERHVAGEEELRGHFVGLQASCECLKRQVWTSSAQFLPHNPAATHFFSALNMNMDGELTEEQIVKQHCSTVQTVLYHQIRYAGTVKQIDTLIAWVRALEGRFWDGWVGLGPTQNFDMTSWAFFVCSWMARVNFGLDPSDPPPTPKFPPPLPGR